MQPVPACVVCGNGTILEQDAAVAQTLAESVLRNALHTHDKPALAGLPFHVALKQGHQYAGGEQMATTRTFCRQAKSAKSTSTTVSSTPQRHARGIWYPGRARAEGIVRWPWCCGGEAHCWPFRERRHALSSGEDPAWISLKLDQSRAACRRVKNEQRLGTTY